jgi:hypothetical protein
MRPLALTEEQLTIVMDGARPLAVADRDGFLLLVAEQLGALSSISNAAVRNAVVSAQRAFFTPPLETDRQPRHLGARVRQ